MSPNEGASVPFVAMELVEGQTFETLLSGGAPSWEALRPLARQVLEGLAAAHEAGIVHRDLKPANLMVTERGHVKILDFGLAKQFRLEGDQSSLGTLVGAPTVPGTALGTVGYMSPEQAKGVPADHRSDQFSFGALLYEMATGECPFRRDTPAESIAALMTATPLSLEQRDTDLPEAICALVMRCLGKAPEERWATTGELLEEFRSRGADRSPVEHVASRGAADRPSIAVLPFADMSADKDQEYFCDGMAEEIINALSQLGTVRVVARTSAFSFKGHDSDLREVGHKLGVRSVLEGSVRKAGNRLRVTAQLINVEDGYHLWSERYDRELEDIFAVQDEISRAVVSELEVKLSPAEPLVPRRAASLEAYDLCVKGRHHFLHFTEHGHEAALRCFRASLEEDPSMAATLAGIAMTCVTSAVLGWGKAQDLIPKAKEAARRAISLDDRAFGAHYALAQAHQSFDWDWLGAEQEFRKELTGCPGNAEARAFFAFFLHGLGQNDAALREAQRAVDADPLSAMSHHMLANVLLGIGRIEEALAESELGVELGAGLHTRLLQSRCGAFPVGKARRRVGSAAQRPRAGSFGPSHACAVGLGLGTIRFAPTKPCAASTSSKNAATGLPAISLPWSTSASEITIRLFTGCTEASMSAKVSCATYLRSWSGSHFVAIPATATSCAGCAFQIRRGQKRECHRTRGRVSYPPECLFGFGLEFDNQRVKRRVSDVLDLVGPGTGFSNGALGRTGSTIEPSDSVIRTVEVSRKYPIIRGWKCIGSRAPGSRRCSTRRTSSFSQSTLYDGSGSSPNSTVPTLGESNRMAAPKKPMTAPATAVRTHFTDFTSGCLVEH